MSNLFNPDNKFFTFMGRVADLMILNILCIICCIPVITIGPAITAMFYVTLKMVRNEESYVIRGFFHSFKQNFRQGVIIHLILLVVGAILLFDLYFTRQMAGENRLYMVLGYVFMVAIALYLMIFTYIYPMLAKFYNSVKNTFRNALLVSIRHLPYTILMLVITAVPVLLMFFVPQTAAYVLLFYILLGFSTIAYINSRFFAKIFDRYIPATEEAENGQGEKDVEIDGSVFRNLHPTNTPPESDGDSLEDGVSGQLPQDTAGTETAVDDGGDSQQQ
ncbi:MAG TPA: YesL family protein [Candidatus Pullilachnospira intestinigallinarum]|nr:YesL family protein [Candidatus Pullilachnospira intestinigallinarum]